MCMQVNRVVLDAKARGTGWKLLVYGKGPFQPIPYPIGEWVEAKLGSTVQVRTLPKEQRDMIGAWYNEYNTDEWFPQGIYMFHTRRDAFTYKTWWLLPELEIHKFEWEGLLAEGVIKNIPTFTVLRARLCETNE